MYGLEIFIRPSTLSRLPTVTFFTKLRRTHKLAYDHCSMTQVYLQILQDVYLYKCDLSEYGSLVYWLINCVYNTKNHSVNFHIIEVKPLWNFCTIQIILNVNSSSIASNFFRLIEVIPVRLLEPGSHGLGPTEEVAACASCG